MSALVSAIVRLPETRCRGFTASDRSVGQRSSLMLSPDKQTAPARRCHVGNSGALIGTELRPMHDRTVRHGTKAVESDTAVRAAGDGF